MFTAKSKIFATHQNMTKTHNFSLLSCDDLLEKIKNPVDYSVFDKDTAKTQSSFMIPTDLTSSKKQADLIAYDKYTCLVIDIDENNKTKKEIVERLKHFGVHHYYLHSTASSTAIEPRFRILIPLCDYFSYHDWHIYQSFMTKLFDADACMERATQIAYLPILSINNFDSYDWDYQRGNLFNPLATTFHTQAVKSDKIEQRKTQAILREQADYREKKRKARETKYGDQQLNKDIELPIQFFNNNNYLLTMFDLYGFKKKNDRGTKWTHPESSTGGAGILVLDDEATCYTSFHGCDNLSMNKKLRCKSNDCFDLYVDMEHSGNEQNAIKAITTSREYKDMMKAARPQRKPDNIVKIEPALTETQIEKQQDASQFMDSERLNKVFAKYANYNIIQLGHEIATLHNYPKTSACLECLSIQSSLLGLNYSVISDQHLGSYNIGLFTLHCMESGEDKSSILKSLQKPTFKKIAELNRKIPKEPAPKHPNKPREDAQFEPDTPRFNPQMFSSGGTPEGFEDKILRNQNGYFCLAMDEQRDMKTFFGLTYSKGNCSNAMVMKGAAGDPHGLIRSGGLSFSTTYHGSITACVQYPFLDLFLSIQDGEGLHARFLMLKEAAIPYDQCVRKTHQKKEDITDSHCKKKYIELSELMVEKLYERKNIKFEELVQVNFSLESSNYLEDFIFNIIYKRKKDSNTSSIEKELLGKAKGHITKVAANLYISDCFACGDAIGEVDIECVKAAQDIVMVIIEEAILYIDGHKEIDNPQHDCILRLITKTKASGKTVRGLLNSLRKNSLFTQYSSKARRERLEEILDLLTKSDDIVSVNDVYISVEFFQQSTELFTTQKS